MKIGIIGNYGATNVGDEAILAVLLKELSNHQVTVFSAYAEKISSPRLRTVPLFPLGIRSFWKFGFKASFQALKKVDVVIFGGGGLFQDDRLYACFLWAWQLFWVRRLKKPYFIYATGVGPLKTTMGKWLTKRAYKGAAEITVRDQQSALLLSQIGVKNKIQVTADPVFLIKIKEAEKDRTKKLFVISLRPWLFYNQKIIIAFAEFLKNLKKERAAEFIFVSMQELREDDLLVIGPILKRVAGKIYIPKDFLDLLKIMERAEFAIGMRYHFMIAALITHTPLLPISYSPKTSSLFEGMPLENQLIKIEDITTPLLKKQFKELSIGYNNAIVYEKALAQNLSEKAEEGIKSLKVFLKRFDPS